MSTRSQLTKDLNGSSPVRSVYVPVYVDRANCHPFPRMIYLYVLVTTNLTPPYILYFREYRNWFHLSLYLLIKKKKKEKRKARQVYNSHAHFSLSNLSRVRLSELFIICRIGESVTWQACENIVKKRGEIRNKAG